MLFIKLTTTTTTTTTIKNKKTKKTKKKRKEKEEHVLNLCKYITYYNKKKVNKKNTHIHKNIWNYQH